MSKYTLVIGASENESRYSNMAIKKLVKYGHKVVAIGLRDGVVDGIPFTKEHKLFDGIDTITLYINETHQQDYYDYIISLKPKRIIFNPGTENPELEELAEKHDIEAVEACTLVMLGTGQY